MTSLIFLVVLAQNPPIVVVQDARQPHLVADRDGVFYCVFLRKGYIELSTSADGGATWTAPVVAMDTKGAAKGGMQRGPRVGVDDRKNVTITAPVCFDPPSTPDRQKPPPELWLVRSTDGGRTFGPPVQVNERNGTAPEALHALAVAPTGEAHVAWLDMRGRGDGQDLYYARVVDGKPGKNVKIGATLCECCAPGIALDGAGNPFIAWRDGATSDSRPVLLVRSKDGGKTFPQPAQVNKVETGVSGCPMDAPAPAVTSDGKKVALAWMDLRAGGNNRRIFWSQTTGGSFAPESALAEIAKGIQGHPSIAFDSAGALHAAWEDFRSDTQQIHYRRADGEEYAISPAKGKASFPSLACGRVVGVAFEHADSILFVGVK